MRWLRFILMALAALLPPVIAHAQQPNITAELVAESERPAPGSIVTLAFRFSPNPGWHGYWKNPGDAGAGMRTEWSLPEGVRAGELRYPVPQTLMIAGLMNYVYEGEHALLVPLSIPAGLAPGTPLPVRVQAEWLACTDEVCVPERGELSLNLIVGDGAIDPARRAQFDAWRARLPRPLGSEAMFERAGDRVRIGIPFPDGAEVAEPYFFALTDGAIDYAAPQQARRDGNRLVIETAARGGEGLKRLDGVLRIAEGVGLEVAARPGAVPAGGRLLSAEDAAPATGVLFALGAAILGGFILNIMPCVFPILSLKALSLVKAGADERAAKREALAYTAGVVLTCLALGGALLALRAGGSALGWAFQLQDPRVITLLLLLVTAIALNLAGLFELGSIGFGERLARSGGSAGAFWTGALAAFVATPCTGPFLGLALGAALVLPTATGLAIFAGLGFGLALPFLLLGFVPALRRRLPKPGPWMERFRHILSIPMFLTALGLAWILGRQAGVDAMALGVLAAMLLGFALWLGAAWHWRALAPALVLALAVVVAIPREPAVAGAAAGGPLDAERFSEARLAALRNEGRPVFVYFTADWCLTCKVNEKGALERASVASAFDQAKVAVLVGDWTNGDPAISRFIERHGHSGVPLYLFYCPGQPKPEVLPQVLTVDRLTSLVS